MSSAVAPATIGATPTTALPADSTTLDRLRDQMPSDHLTSWLITALIAALAFGIRIWNLGFPNTLVFDETFYAKDAYSLLTFGYERDWPTDANAQITAGNVDVFSDSAAFIVHPPLGKWLIAAGQAVFGMNSFGWRISACVFGTLLIVATIRLARRLSRSTLIGAIAGLLLTFDGLAFVMSRVALLDIFQAAFLVTAVSLLLVDRDWFRNKLARYIVGTGRSDLAGRYGPLALWRPRRLAAWVSFGLACGVKWNTIFVMAGFGLLSVVWDVGARRLAGAGRLAGLGFIGDGVPAAWSMLLVSGAVYLSTWTGWLATTGGYDRDWGVKNPDEFSVRVLGAPLASLIKYHQDIYGFHRGDYIKSATHQYDAHPLGWLVLARPIGIDAVNQIQPGTDGCVGPDTCLRVISGIGTPMLWWTAVVCLLVAMVIWVGTRDWRFGVPIVGVATTWLPWFQYTDRPQFFFYAILIVPFSATAVALCLGKLLGPGRRAGPEPAQPAAHPAVSVELASPGVVAPAALDPPPPPKPNWLSSPRLFGAIVATGVVVLVMLNFAYLYPVLTDQVLAYPQWRRRMWFTSWI